MSALIKRGWVHSTFWFKFGLVLWAAIFAFSAIPTERYIYIESVEITNWYQTTDEPQNRILLVNRSIYRNFKGGYRVEEQRKIAFNEWLTVKACENVKPIQYRTDKSLPNPLLVSWWAFGRCDVLPSFPPENSAILRLCTWHYVAPIPFLPFILKASKPVCSNEYQGRLLP